jgi:hypothetical protein
VATETTTSVRGLPPSLLDTGAVDLIELRKQLRALATLGASEALMVSCYASVEYGLARRDVIERRVRAIRATLSNSQRGELDGTMSRIYAQLEQRSSRTRGMAVFARGGDAPYFRALEFRVPLPELVILDRAPVIYPLVELKDTFHRFVVVISTEASARILEVSLGAVTREIWTTAPALAEDVRRQWSRDHYQNHRQDRAERFLKEKLDLLDRLMSANGHTHLILAGDPRLTARIRDRLPDRLRAKLVDIVPAPADSDHGDVVQAALASFIEQEQQESFDAADTLCREVRRGAMAEIGTFPSIEVLQRGQADLLVMTGSYDPGRGWLCTICETVTNGPEQLLDTCSHCGGQLAGVDLREHLVQLAERTGCGFERVSHHDQLSELGGVGCLLRYARPGR